MKKAGCTLKIGCEELEIGFEFRGEIPNFAVGHFIQPILFVPFDELSRARLHKVRNESLLSMLYETFIIRKITWLSEELIFMDLELKEKAELYPGITEG